MDKKQIDTSVLKNQTTAIMLLDDQYTIHWFNQSFSKTVAQRIENYCTTAYNDWLGNDFFHMLNAYALKPSFTHVSEPKTEKFQLEGFCFDIHISQFYCDESVYFLLEWQEITEQVGINKQLQDIVAETEKGKISKRIDMEHQCHTFETLAGHINSILDNISKLMIPLSEALGTMAECNLQTQLPTDLKGKIGNLYSRYNVSLSNLTEALRQTLSSSENINETTHDIVEQNHQLSLRTDEQAKSLEITASNINELASTVANTADNAGAAVEQAQKANQLAEKGQQEVERLVQLMKDMYDNSIEASDIVEMINSIAFQTNILSLNASIEAARAGVHGKSFSVVANEVRTLSISTADAAHRIRRLMKASEELSQQGVFIADHVSGSMDNVLGGVANASQSIEEISRAAKEQSLGIHNVKQTIDTIDTITKKNHDLVINLGNRTQALKRQSSYLNDAAQVFTLSEDGLSHPLHHLALEVAIKGAQGIKKRLETAINQNQLSLGDIIGTTYQEIDHTNPQQYYSNYDEYTDQYFPDIQEPPLTEHDFIIYAIATDRNSYVPTHNLAFAQAATGDYDTDLKYSRSKRMYKDRVGEICGQHQESWKLQTYRRDTGELVFDLSVPIYIQNNHFGGFRVGYRIE